MSVKELIEELKHFPVDAEVYVDLAQRDCLAVESVDVEEDDGEVTVYLVVSV